MKKKPNPTLAELLVAARTAKGLSQQEVAEQADVSLSGYQKWEQSLVDDPNFHQLARAATVLGIDLDDIKAALDRRSSRKA